MRRVVSVWLPYLSTDRLDKSVARDKRSPAGFAGNRIESGRSPAGFAGNRIESGPPPAGTLPNGEPPLAVAENGGQRRLVAVNRAAERAGLRSGMRLADALAIRPSLQVAPAAPDEEEALLRRLAAWCGSYSPMTAADCWREGVAGAGLWLDISGCAHLWGGEVALLDDLTKRIGRLGFTARAAVADSAGAAWAWARFGAGGVLAPGTQRDLLAPLPLPALRLAPDRVTGLARLGLRRIGDLYDVARAPLTARFGPEALRRLDQALGQIEEPLAPLRSSGRLMVQRRFVYPIGRSDDLEAALRLLLPQLLVRLERRQLGARQIDLEIFHADTAIRRMTIGTSRPSRDAAGLGRLLTLKLDGLDLGDSGIESLILSAAVTEPLTSRQLDLTQSEESGSVAQLLDGLGNRLGFPRLHRFAPAGSHLPERAVWRRPLDSLATAGSAGADRWPALRRPPILLSRPEALAVTAPLPDAPPLLFRWRQTLHRVRSAEGPERLAAEWWRQEAPTRDYYLVEDQGGARFWLYRRGLPGEFNPARWFLHGMFG